MKRPLATGSKPEQRRASVIRGARCSPLPNRLLEDEVAILDRLLGPEIAKLFEEEIK